MNTASLRVVFIRYRYGCFWNPSHPGQDVSKSRVWFAGLSHGCDGWASSTESCHHEKKSLCSCSYPNQRNVCHFLLIFYLFFTYYFISIPITWHQRCLITDGQPWIERQHRPVKGNRSLLSKWALSHCCFFLRTMGKIVRTGKVLLTGIFVTQPVLIWGIAPWPGKPILQQMAFLAHFSPICNKITLRMPVSRRRFFGSDQSAWLCFSAKL